MHVIQSLLRPFGSRAPIILIAVFFTVEMFLRNHYVGAVNEGPGDAYIRSLTPDQKKVSNTVGVCIEKADEEKIGNQCAYEIVERPVASVGKDEGVTSANALDVCVKFEGFRSESSNCHKIYCFSLKYSVTFWVLAIGVPIALIIAIGVIIWMCCHFSYYMCCCCIFHMELPKWFKKAQTKAKVSPEGNTPKAQTKKTDASKDKAKEVEKDKDAAEKGKEENKDKEEDDKEA